MTIMTSEPAAGGGDRAGQTQRLRRAIYRRSRADVTVTWSGSRTAGYRVCWWDGPTVPQMRDVVDDLAAQFPAVPVDRWNYDRQASCIGAMTALLRHLDSTPADRGARITVELALRAHALLPYPTGGTAEEAVENEVWVGRAQVVVQEVHSDVDPDQLCGDHLVELARRRPGNWARTLAWLDRLVARRAARYQVYRDEPGPDELEPQAPAEPEPEAVAPPTAPAGHDHPLVPPSTSFDMTVASVLGPDAAPAEVDLEPLCRLLGATHARCESCAEMLAGWLAEYGPAVLIAYLGGPVREAGRQVAALHTAATGQVVPVHEVLAAVYGQNLAFVCDTGALPDIDAVAVMARRFRELTPPRRRAVVGGLLHAVLTPPMTPLLLAAGPADRSSGDTALRWPP
jgi:hypothetical protein